MPDDVELHPHGHEIAKSAFKGAFPDTALVCCQGNGEAMTPDLEQEERVAKLINLVILRPVRRFRAGQAGQY